MAIKINTPFSSFPLAQPITDPTRTEPGPNDFSKVEKDFRLDLIALGDQTPSVEEMKEVIQRGKEVLNISIDPLSLVKLLLKSLAHFPTLYQEQLDLADLSVQKLLSQAKKKTLDLRLPLYTTAMYYYGKAITIAQKFDPSQIKELSIKTSKIFMLVINDQVVTLKSFQKRLDRASGFTDLSQFQTILDEIALLKNYRCDPNDHEIILSLYEQAHEVLLGIQKTKENTTPFAPFARQIRQEKQEAYIPQNFPTAVERYQTKLSHFRETFKTTREGLVQKEVRPFQKAIHQEFLSFFQTFLQDAFAILGPPPCAYDLRACGSLAREEFCPYSDIEWMILIEDSKHTPYFKTLAEIINLQIFSLGETAATDLPVFSALGEKNRSGFHVDTGGNPAADNLIGPPQTLALLQKGEGNDTVPTLAFHSLRRTTPLEEKKDMRLFESYTQAMNQILDHQNLRKKRALGLLKARLEQYKTCFNNTWRQEPLLTLKKTSSSCYTTP